MPLIPAHHVAPLFNAGKDLRTLTGSGSCINGQSAAQSLESNYPNYEWKVELMNQCNQRSNQVSF